MVPKTMSVAIDFAMGSQCSAIAVAIDGSSVQLTWLTFKQAHVFDPSNDAAEPMVLELNMTNENEELKR